MGCGIPVPWDHSLPWLSAIVLGFCLRLIYYPSSDWIRGLSTHKILWNIWAVFTYGGIMFTGKIIGDLMKINCWTVYDPQGRSGSELLESHLLHKINIYGSTLLPQYICELFLNKELCGVLLSFCMHALVSFCGLDVPLLPGTGSSLSKIQCRVNCYRRWMDYAGIYLIYI